jgi:hypothetical protein
MTRILICVAIGVATASFARAADDALEQTLEWKAAVASTTITPQRPLSMAGYAGRKEPAEGSEQELFAKALAIEDCQGRRVVIVTMDLIGVIGRLREVVATRVQEEYELLPNALLMNASHTHCGPVRWAADFRVYACQRDLRPDWTEGPQQLNERALTERYEATADL